jgi:hypothetical protein
MSVSIPFDSEYKLSPSIIFISHLVMLITLMRLNVFIFIDNTLGRVLKVYNFIVFFGWLLTRWGLVSINLILSLFYNLLKLQFVIVLPPFWILDHDK